MRNTGGMRVGLQRGMLKVKILVVGETQAWAKSLCDLQTIDLACLCFGHKKPELQPYVTGCSYTPLCGCGARDRSQLVYRRA